MFKIIKRRKTQFNYYRSNTDIRKNYNKQIILLVLFVLGLIVGALTVRNGINGLLSNLMSIYENYIDIKKSEAAVVNFSNSVFTLFAKLILMYMVGLCAVGTPFLYAVPLVSGIGAGLLSSYLYSEYALKGVGYCTLIIFPGKTVSTAVMIAACAASIEMSTKMLKMLTNNDEKAEFRNYNIKYLLFAIITTFSALTDTILNALFANYFIFH